GNSGHLTGTITGRTGFISGTFGLHFAFDLDLLFNSVGNLLQSKSNTDPQIASFHDTSSTAAKTSETTKTTTSKSSSKDVTELAEDIVHVHTSSAKAT